MGDALARLWIVATPDRSLAVATLKTFNRCLAASRPGARRGTLFRPPRKRDLAPDAGSEKGHSYFFEKSRMSFFPRSSFSGQATSRSWSLYTPTRL